MKAFSALLSRTLDAVEIAFEAVGALWRVAARGAFAPDARSYRGARFAALGAEDVLAQEIGLNAADAGEAKKAIALDAERLLPLAPDLVVYDVAGPIETDARPRARPERAFLLGVVRKDTLERLRAELSPLSRGGVEAFVFTPSAHPKLALLFGDEPGRKRRRFRRAALAASLAVLIVTAIDAGGAATAALERQVAAAEAERVAVERRIRLAERREARSRAAREALAQAAGPRLDVVSTRLNRLALHLPGDAELSTAAFEGRALVLSGRAYAPDAAELALRRAFEGDEISFSAADGEAPLAFEARLTFAPEASP